MYGVRSIHVRRHVWHWFHVRFGDCEIVRLALRQPRDCQPIIFRRHVRCIYHIIVRVTTDFNVRGYIRKCPRVSQIVVHIDGSRSGVIHFMNLGRGRIYKVCNNSNFFAFGHVRFVIRTVITYRNKSVYIFIGGIIIHNHFKIIVLAWCQLSNNFITIVLKITGIDQYILRGCVSGNIVPNIRKQRYTHIKIIINNAIPNIGSSWCCFIDMYNIT